MQDFYFFPSTSTSGYINFHRLLWQKAIEPVIGTVLATRRSKQSGSVEFRALLFNMYSNYDPQVHMSI